MLCTQIFSDQFIGIWMSAECNVQYIWIVMQKLSGKQALDNSLLSQSQRLSTTDIDFMQHWFCPLVSDENTGLGWGLLKHQSLISLLGIFPILYLLDALNPIHIWHLLLQLS